MEAICRGLAFMPRQLVALLNTICCRMSVAVWTLITYRVLDWQAATYRVVGTPVEGCCRGPQPGKMWVLDWQAAHLQECREHTLTESARGCYKGPQDCHLQGLEKDTWNLQGL